MTLCHAPHRRNNGVVFTSIYIKSMNKKDMLAALDSAYTSKHSEARDEDITILNEQSPLYELMKSAQFKLNEHTQAFELDYSIMNDACMAMSNLDEDTLEDMDPYELSMDTASVYTATQLSWLNIWNQGEIADIVREHETDIGTACAVWYEQQVAYACELVRDMINENAQ